MAEPSRSEIDDFIRANDVDDRAAADLRDCPPDVQRKVLARGELSTARNPSAALLARIRDARVSGSSGASGMGNGLRGSADVEDFIQTNDVDESAADSLRSSSPTVQRAVLSRGELKTARNPSSALLARIRDAKMGVGVGAPNSMSVLSLPPGGPPALGAYVGGAIQACPGNGSYPSAYGAPPPGAYGSMYPGGPPNGPGGYGGGYPLYPNAGMYPGYPSGPYGGAPGGASIGPGGYGSAYAMAGYSSHYNMGTGAPADHVTGHSGKGPHARSRGRSSSRSSSSSSSRSRSRHRRHGRTRRR